MCPQQALYALTQFRVVAAGTLQKCGTLRGRQMKRLRKQSYVVPGVSFHDFETNRLLAGFGLENLHASIRLVAFQSRASAKQPSNPALSTGIHILMRNLNRKATKKALEPS